MQRLLFLSRVAFLCNLFFLVSFILRFTEWSFNEGITSYIIVIGWVLSVVINPVAVICYLVIFIFKSKSREGIPLWLMAMNILFLILQLVFLLLMNIDKF